MYANLHFHSTYSDGVYTPDELVNIAISEGYKALALTDHDTAAGNGALIEACKARGLEYILGAELSGAGFGKRFHIVALDFDPDNPKMKEHLDYMSKKCIYRTKGMFDNGVQRGTIKDITWEEIVADNRGVEQLCVDHVFLTMKKKGVISDSEYKDFHKNNFSYSIPFENIYDDRSVEEVITTINEAGGVAILAHPGYGGDFDYVPELIKYGLRGIETWHADHNDEAVAEAERLAKKYRLYESGGTDHSGLMGGQYQYYADKAENPYYCPSLKYGVSEENFRKIKDRIWG